MGRERETLTGQAPRKGRGTARGDWIEALERVR